MRVRGPAADSSSSAVGEDVTDPRTVAARGRSFWSAIPKREAVVGGVALLVLLSFLLNRAPSWITDKKEYATYKAASSWGVAECGKAPEGWRNAWAVAAASSSSSSSSPSSSISSSTDEEMTLQDAVLAAFDAEGTRHLVLAESNTGFAAITENWLRRWNALSSSFPRQFSLLAVSLDAMELARLQRSHVRTWADSKHFFTTEAQGFAGTSYKSIVCQKWTLLEEALEGAATHSASSSSAAAGAQGVLLTDVDVLPFRDPFAYISTLPHCDAYFSTESSGPGVLFSDENAWYPDPGHNGGAGGGVLRKAKKAVFGEGAGAAAEEGMWKSANYINTGFLYLRPTEVSRKFVRDVAAALAVLPPDADGDQPVANDVLEGMRKKALAEGKIVRNVVDLSSVTSPKCSQYGDFTFWMMSPYLVQNGKHAWENGGLTKMIREPPISRHYNFLGFTHDGKVAAMKVDGSWALEKGEERELACRGTWAKG